MRTFLLFSSCKTVEYLVKGRNAGWLINQLSLAIVQVSCYKKLLQTKPQLSVTAIV